jgi:hypothetical protein
MPHAPENPSAFAAAAYDSKNDKVYHQKGMTLRDWFAGQAMQGYLSASWYTDKDKQQELVKRSYEVADAMLEAGAV